MPLKVGDTFFMSGTGGASNPAGAHLMVCIVLDKPNDVALIVPIVTQRPYSDTACLLKVGDHPFLKHDSCAAYDHVQALSLSKVDAEIQAGTVTLKAPVSKAVHGRLQVGFVLSDETAPWSYTAGHGQLLEAHLKQKGLL